ncbi:MAG TPA: DUF4383 domain-containing protein [Flavobacterium sp.]|nr:DUF4383 domain-containing protein [Flavobacterium sp.]
MSAKNIVTLLGVVFLVLGIWGFFTSEILGLFAVDTVHNVIHLVSGIVALAMAARGEDSARVFAQVFGAAYAIITIVGLLWPNDHVLGMVTIDTAGNFLHLVLAVVLIWIGYRREGVTVRTM